MIILLRNTVILFVICLVFLILPIQAQHSGFHGKPEFPKLNYDSLFDAATPLSQSTEGQALLEDCLSAYGGKASLEKISGVRSTWKLRAVLGNDSLDVTRTYASGNKHRTDMVSDDGTVMSRFMIGDTAWQKTSDTITIMNRNRTILEFFHYLNAFLPLSITDPRFGEIRYGTRVGDSREYLYARLEDKLIYSVGIDPETHWVVSSEGAIMLEEDQRNIYVSLFSEHSLENGLLVPHRFDFVSMGLKVGQNRLVEVEINPNLPDGYFRLKE